MAAPVLRFHLHELLRRRAEAGNHNFINKIAEVVQAAGFAVEYAGNGLPDLMGSALRPGFAMFHMDEPTHPRALTMRKVYEFPFWAIESTGKRWEWAAARSAFTAEDVPRKTADGFYRFWQKRLFKDAPQSARREGFVYVPLQGKLLSHRSFQSCTPIEMIEAVLAHDPARAVIATLHPKEEYTGPELRALEALAQGNRRLTLRTGGMSDLLPFCDYVVTQNSAVAFSGYFFGKPAVLFGQIDFHHIAANVQDLGVAEAMARVPELAPDYAGYIHWFWQVMSINAGRDEAAGQIRARLLAAGWPV